MKAHTYLTWVVAGALLSTAIFLGSFFWAFGNSPESGRWVAEVLYKKIEAVKNYNPDVIILSGSNSLFGFSAQRLSQVHHVETINLAIHAGLGIKYILGYGEQFFAPKRVFILPLEYELYGKPEPNSAFRDQVMGYDHHYFWSMSPSEKIHFFTQISFDERLRYIKNLFYLDMHSELDGYQSNTLNQYGDETNNMLGNRPPGKLSELHSKRAKQYVVDEEAWAELENFANAAKSMGVTVVIAYPNIYYKAFDKKLNESFFSDLQRRATKLDIKIIGSPDSSVFFDDSLFDTIYHQNNVGQQKSTDRLFYDLKNESVIH